MRRRLGWSALRVLLRVVAVVAIGGTSVVACDAGAPDAPPRRPDSVSASPGTEAPVFEFAVGERAVMPTARGRVSERDRRVAREAAGQVRSLVTALYVGAFLDPEQWTSGSYEDVFDLFAGGARTEARQRAGVLTAGEDAADRFDRIEPMKGRLLLRVLLDRGDNPFVVSSRVRFRARGVGPEPVLIRSDGSYLFRRIDGSWRIVSFGVQRSDRERSGA